MNGQTVVTTQGSLLITTRLAWGVHGEVYKTNHPEYLVKVCKPFDVSEPAAIKALKQDFGQRYQTFAQLGLEKDREVSCLPLQALAVEDNGPTPAYLMRKAPGLSLGDHWPTLVKLSLRERYRLAYSLAKAFSYLHSRAVVHADVKPDNFFFDASAGVVSILDIDGGGYFGHYPGTVRFCPAVWTPLARYQPPEFVASASWPTLWQRPDHLTTPMKIQPDLWSLAVLLYQILVDSEGPFPSQWFQPEAYAQATPAWPHPQQKTAMASIGLDAQIFTLFEAIFSATARMRLTNPDRPQAVSWQAALEPLWKTGAPQPVPRPAPQPVPRPAPQPVPRPAPQPVPRPGPQPTWRQRATDRGRRLAVALELRWLVLHPWRRWGEVAAGLGAVALAVLFAAHQCAAPAPSGPSLPSPTAVLTPSSPRPAPGLFEPSPAQERKAETVPPPPEEPPPPSPERVRWAQARLRDCGFKPGPIDGDLGPQTEAALRRYQDTKAGLLSTGELDEATEWALIAERCRRR